jgi:hypothetical protein
VNETARRSGVFSTIHRVPGNRHKWTPCPENINRDCDPDRKTDSDQSNLDLKIFIKTCPENFKETPLKIFSPDLARKTGTATRAPKEFSD